MKKSLLMLGVAVAALASCTQNEVMEVAEGRAIQFNTFVNNSTKVVIEVPKGELASSEFYVFGNYGTNQSTWTGQAYNNETGDTKYYWQNDNYYRFGAYANGAGGKINNASFNAATQTLTFPAYTPADACDLIAYVPAEVNVGTDATTQTKVQLNFKHMLAQVAFEFTTDAADIYELKISNVKINGAINKTEGSINQAGAITWESTGEGVTKDGYTYEDFKEGVDIADGNLKPTPRTKMQSKLVIPQDLPTAADYITVTFTATLKDGNAPESEPKSQNFTANLSFTQQTGDGINDPDSNKWTAGYRYKYTTKITADMIDDTLTDKEIEFTATVEEWKDASDTTIDEDALTSTPTPSVP